VSPGGTYVVRLSGRVTSAGFFEHRVRAEVYKNGILHLPARLIYVAGLFDTAFEDRFGPPEWVAANVLRFPGKITPAGPQPDVLHVRNAAPRPFRSIRIETAKDMFMAFDLAAGAAFTFPMTAPVDVRWFDVLVDSGDPDVRLHGHGTFGRLRHPSGPHAFSVDVSANGVTVTAR
jgi:hypothetical protein